MERSQLVQSDTYDSHPRTREEAAARWLVALRPELLRYLKRCHGYLKQADHEDILQEAYLAFVGHPATDAGPATGYHGDMSSRTGVWAFFRSAANITSRNHLQRETGTRDPLKAISVISLSDPAIVSELETVTVDPEAEGAIEAARIYEYLLEGLPKTLQLLVDKYYIKGMTVEEICTEFDIKHNVQLFRMLAKARSLIAPRLAEVRRMRKEGLL